MPEGGKAGSVGRRTYDGKQGRGRIEEMPICLWNRAEATTQRMSSNMEIVPYNRLITKGHKKCSQ